MVVGCQIKLNHISKCNPVAVPVSNFEAVCGSQSGCAGSSINFFDLSEGDPTSWSWSFSGGSPATSTSQYPTVSYATPGTYAVSLTATNSFGAGNAETKTGFITIYSTPTAACTPSSQNAGNYWQTLYNVTFNEINNSTSQYVNTAYTDFSCSQTTVVNEGDSYQLSISINAEGGSGNEVFEAYIDYNNNGSFADAGEMVFSGSVTSGSLGTFNQNIAIPLTATTNTLLRMRVIGETTSISTNERNCAANYFVGDVEDYGVYILAAGTPPVANFSGTPTTLCVGNSVSFSDLSTNTPTSWSWTFTGGTPSSSSVQNPTITYNTPGTYQVQLTATNASGSDGETKVGYITVNPAPSISSHPTNSTINDGENTSFSVTASNATGYQWQVNTGGGFGNISNGGVYSNATTATLNITGVTLAMDGYTYRCVVSGNCTPNTTSNSALLTVNPLGSAPVADFSANQTVICAGESINFTDLSTNTPTSWFWDFGDGGTSSSQNTTYTYNTAGTYTVTLTATNASGSDLEIKVDYITVNNCIGPMSLSNNSCGITLSSYGQCINVPGIPGAEDYQYEFSNVGLGFLQTYIKGSNKRALYLNVIPGIQNSTTYDVRVKVKVAGVWGSYGPICQVTTPEAVGIKLIDSDCGIILGSYMEDIRTEWITGAEDFEYEFVNVGLSYSQTYQRGTNKVNLYVQSVPGILTNTTYDVRVRAKVAGVWGTFGTTCQIQHLLLNLLLSWREVIVEWYYQVIHNIFRQSTFMGLKIMNLNFQMAWIVI